MTTIGWSNSKKEIYWGNETLSGDYLFHINPSVGDDLLGDGSEENPWATQEKSTEWVGTNTTSSDVSLVLLHAGDYYSYSDGSGFGEVGVADNVAGVSEANRKTMIFVGFEKETKIIITGTNPGRDASAVTSISAGSKFIGITFDYDHNDRSNNFSRAIFRNISAAPPFVFAGEVRNCHFIARKQSAISYSNGGIANGHCYNCSFDLLNGWENSYSGQMPMTNCVFTDSVPSQGVTFPNNPGLLTTSFDTDHKPTSGSWQNTGFGLNQDGSQANYSVYGGTYDWDAQYEAPPVFIGEGHGGFWNDTLPSNTDMTGYKFVQVGWVAPDTSWQNFDNGGNKVGKYYHPITKETVYKLED